MRLTRTTAGLAALVASFAVGGTACTLLGERDLPERQVGDRLAELRRSSGPPVYYLGRSFEKLPLVAVLRDQQSPGLATFIYGDCEVEGGWFDDGGCEPPLQVQNKECSDGTVVAVVYGTDGRQTRRAANELRPLDPRDPPRPQVFFGSSPAC